MSRGRSTSPHPLHDADVDMDVDTKIEKPNANVVIVTNLSRSVVEAHLQTIFGHYGEITKIDLPLFGKCVLSFVVAFGVLILLYSRSESWKGRSRVSGRPCST